MFSQICGKQVNGGIRYSHKIRSLQLTTGKQKQWKKKENCSTEQKIYISLSINVNGHVTYEMNTLKGYFGLDDSIC